VKNINKKTKEYLLTHELSLSGVKKLLDWTEEERIEVYGEKYRLLVTKYINRKKLAKQTMENRLELIKNNIKEAEEVANKLEIGGW